MAGLSSLTFQFTPSIQVNGQLNQAGASPIGNAQQLIQNLTAKIGTAQANNAVNGGDEAYFLESTIAPSGTLTINLQSFTDLCNQASVSLARLKFAFFALIGTNQTMPDGSVGNACSSITIGNAGSNPHPLNMNSGTDTFTVTNAGSQAILDGSAAGMAVNGGASNIKILNNDSVNSAKVFVCFVGGSS